METTLKFLKQLAKNNRKEWFDENRKTYETSKAEFEAIVKSVIDKSIVFDKLLIGLEAKKCLFRINKDVRFSKDKSPYKLNMGASINPGGKKSMIAGYYIHIEPGKSFLAGGTWQPMPEVLAAIRQEIDYNSKEFRKILAAKDFKTYFGGLSEEDKLKTAPKGYEKTHPDLDLLQHKSFIVVHDITDAQVMDKNFPTYVAKVFKAMLPLNSFLRNSGE
ncbi:MAG: DUF2461 domain-containing protein [Bacteroidota bacterium]